MLQKLSIVLYHCEICDGPVVYCMLDNDERIKPVSGDEATCIRCGKKYLPTQLKGKSVELGPVEWTA